MITRLYPPVKVEAQSFKGAKIVTVPNQSMTLQEIIKRFTRKESLPIEKEGVYAENLGDLEKLAHADFTVRNERAEEINRSRRQWKKRKDDDDAAAAAAGGSGEPLKGATPPVQTPTTPPPPGPHPGSHDS